MKPLVVSLLKRKVLTAVVFMLLVGGVWLVSRRGQIESDYQAQGFQMVKGCNGGTATASREEVLTLQERLADFANSPGANTNVIAQLLRLSPLHYSIQLCHFQASGIGQAVPAPKRGA